MNDFLQQLRNSSDYKRNGNDKRFNKSRKHYTGNLYPNNESARDWNRNAQAEPGQDKTPSLQRMLEIIAETQTRLADIEERRAEAEERQALAMEQGVQSVNHLVERLNASGQDASASLLNSLSSVFTGATRTSLFRKSDHEYRQRVIQVIAEMREARATYDEIASYLEQQKMPTFSGRGNWHAQTIHRICRQICE